MRAKTRVKCLVTLTIPFHSLPVKDTFVTFGRDCHISNLCIKIIIIINLMRFRNVIPRDTKRIFDHIFIIAPLSGIFVV